MNPHTFRSESYKNKNESFTYQHAGSTSPIWPNNTSMLIANQNYFKKIISAIGKILEGAYKYLPTVQKNNSHTRTQRYNQRGFNTPSFYTSKTTQPWRAPNRHQPSRKTAKLGTHEETHEATGPVFKEQQVAVLHCLCPLFFLVNSK